VDSRRLGTLWKDRLAPSIPTTPDLRTGQGTSILKGEYRVAGRLFGFALSGCICASSLSLNPCLSLP
jgi:hypothetical protein